MPVFISHRTIDDELANHVYKRLTEVHQIKCWMDSVNAHSNPVTITKQILDGINGCTHLFAVVTRNTDGSWWVPYEIGVAEQGARAITTFSQLSKGVLPEYLWHWPVIGTDYQIDQFAAVYKLEKFTIETANSTAIKAASERAQSVGSGTAVSFHRSLKTKLGQL